MESKTCEYCKHAVKEYNPELERRCYFEKSYNYGSIVENDSTCECFNDANWLEKHVIYRGGT